jgi:hypothetical protein
MTDLNIEDFCKDSAMVLSTLYQTFPRRHTLFVEDICGHEDTDEFGIHSDRHLACLAAMLWLAEEGFLRYEDTIRQEAVDLAVLTGRAFTLLTTPCADFHPPEISSLPPSVRLEHRTYLYRLRYALQQKSSVEIREAVLELMTRMLQGSPQGDLQTASGDDRRRDRRNDLGGDRPEPRDLSAQGE